MFDEKSITKFAAGLRPDLNEGRIQHFQNSGQKVKEAIERAMQLYQALDDLDKFIDTNQEGPAGFARVQRETQKVWNEVLVEEIPIARTNDMLENIAYPNLEYFAMRIGQVGHFFLVNVDRVKDPRFREIANKSEGAKLSDAELNTLKEFCRRNAVNSRTFIIDQKGEYEREWKAFLRTNMTEILHKYLFPSLQKFHEREMRWRKLFFMAKDAYTNYMAECRKHGVTAAVLKSDAEFFFQKHHLLKTLRPSDPTAGHLIKAFYQQILRA